MIRFIAAMDSRRGIATDTGIPWKLPGDSAYFRRQTEAGLIVMGRATYQEFSAPLHERDNYVLTRSADPLRDGFQTVHDFDEFADGHASDDIWVIGGAMVFAATMARAEELYITQVLVDFDCTKFFPDYDDEFAIFDQGDEQQENGVGYRFERWRRREP
jgi:dihydrofolate reductase